MSDEHEVTKAYVDALQALGATGPQGSVGISGCPTGPSGAVGPEHDYLPLLGGSLLTDCTFASQLNIGPVRIIPGDPVDIQIDQGMEYTGAAKMFLNEVFKLMGKESPFSWR